MKKFLADEVALTEEMLAGYEENQGEPDTYAEFGAIRTKLHGKFLRNYDGFLSYRRSDTYGGISTHCF